MDWCLHIWPLTVNLWRQWSANDISGLLFPVASLSLGSWDTKIRSRWGQDIEQSANWSANSHPIVADIRTEAKATFIYMPWANLRVFPQCTLYSTGTYQCPGNNNNDDNNIQHGPVLCYVYFAWCSRPLAIPTAFTNFILLFLTPVIIKNNNNRNNEIICRAWR